jgi:hypothetical protein
VVLPLRHYLDFYGFTRLTFILMVIVTAVKIIVGFIAVPRGLVNGVIWMQGISITVHAVMAVFAVLSVSRNTASPVRI